MAYRDFTLKQIQMDFQLDLVKETHIFALLPPQTISPHLAESLAENVTLAISINTEKARSELIIANVLVELRRILERKVSFFSGIEFYEAPTMFLDLHDYSIDNPQQILGILTAMIKQEA